MIILWHESLASSTYSHASMRARAATARKERSWQEDAARTTSCSGSNKWGCPRKAGSADSLSPIAPGEPPPCAHVSSPCSLRPSNLATRISPCRCAFSSPPPLSMDVRRTHGCADAQSAFQQPPGSFVLNETVAGRDLTRAAGSPSVLTLADELQYSPEARLRRCLSPDSCPSHPSRSGKPAGSLGRFKCLERAQRREHDRNRCSYP